MSRCKFSILLYADPPERKTDIVERRMQYAECTRTSNINYRPAEPQPKAAVSGISVVERETCSRSDGRCFICRLPWYPP